jgi:SAM-dependent methyltransferase
LQPLAPPSPFFLAWAERLREAARAGPVVDLACGRGRHALAAAALGARVWAVDRDAACLAELRERARSLRLRVHCLRADLENGHGIPIAPGTCAATLVFRFLFRPLAPEIAGLLRPGGLLLYETFTRAQLGLPGGPRNPAFLLEPGELRALFSGLEPLASWEGVRDGSQALAQLAARRASRA